MFQRFPYLCFNKENVCELRVYPSCWKPLATQSRVSATTADGSASLWQAETSASLWPPHDEQLASPGDCWELAELGHRPAWLSSRVSTAAAPPAPHCQSLSSSERKHLSLWHNAPRMLRPTDGPSIFIQELGGECWTTSVVGEICLDRLLCVSSRGDSAV